MDALLFEAHFHICSGKGLDGLLAFHRIAGKAGDALDQDEIDLSAHGCLHHLSEGWPGFHAGAAATPVGVDACEIPVRIAFDEIFVIADLPLIAFFLLA